MTTTTNHSANVAADAHAIARHAAELLRDALRWQEAAAAAWAAADGRYRDEGFSDFAAEARDYSRRHYRDADTLRRIVNR